MQNNKLLIQVRHKTNLNPRKIKYNSIDTDTAITLPLNRSYILRTKYEVVIPYPYF